MANLKKKLGKQQGYCITDHKYCHKVIRSTTISVSLWQIWMSTPVHTVATPLFSTFTHRRCESQCECWHCLDSASDRSQSQSRTADETAWTRNHFEPTTGSWSCPCWNPADDKQRPHPPASSCGTNKQITAWKTRKTSWCSNGRDSPHRRRAAQIISSCSPGVANEHLYQVPDSHGAHESASQTASKLVQPSGQGSSVYPTQPHMADH